MQGVDNPDQAPLRSAQAPSETVLIFTHLSKYAVGCYLRYGGFPRRTLLGSSVIKPASLRPGTGSVYQGRRVSAKYYLFLVCAHSLQTAYERGPAPHGYKGCGRRNGLVQRGAG